MMAMTQHYIWVLLYQKNPGVVLIAVIPQHCNALHVSMLKPQPDFQQILLRDHRQRTTFWNKTACSRAIVYRPTIISLLFLVDSHTHLVANKMVIPVAIYLWIMQVEKYSTFPNIPTLLQRLLKVHFGWRQWFRKKVFVSKHITPTMAFLLHLSPKTIVRSIIRSILLVGLALNTRTELLKETLRQLPMGMCQHASLGNPLALTCQLNLLASSNWLCGMGVQQTSKYGIWHSSKWNLVRCPLSTHRAILFACLWVPSLCTQRVSSRWKENAKMESLCMSWAITGFLRSAFLSGSFSPQRCNRSYFPSIPRNFWW